MKTKVTRVRAGVYSVVDDIARIWELLMVSSNPSKSRWVLMLEGSEKSYKFYQKKDAIEYIEGDIRDMRKPKPSSGAMTKEEMANFDWNDPNSFWPPSS